MFSFNILHKEEFFKSNLEKAYNMGYINHTFMQYIIKGSSYAYN